ncbi:oligomeric, coiled-coil, peripheral membrane protein [Sporothrix eucalyptigena]|uniref:Autophagy-related protein 11 n=1 Tax=Sporothrix eucalyptigena TaxID=1812306 RepID=A0ABP0D2L1_9PEZI
MANEVLIAHTGQRLHLDFAQILSLDEFRTIVSRQTSIPNDYIIALTPSGKPLKLAAFQTEKEAYVYDARTTQSDAASAAALANLEIPLPKRYTVSNPPNDLRDQRSLSAWQDLFHSRQQWATAVANDCSSKSGAAQERYAEMDAMMRCLDAAVANLEAVVKTVDGKYNEIKKWVGSAQVDYSRLVERWEQYLELARNISISPTMLRFMTGQNGGAAYNGKSSGQRATLEDLVDLETARKAGKLAPAALRRFNNKIAELERTAPRLFQGSDEVMQSFERTVDRSTLSHEGESIQLLQDIKAVANKIGTDYQTTLEYADSTRDVLQASKIAATHTERLLPSIKNRAAEMDEMFRYATQSRNALAVESVDFMRRITDLTTLSSEIKQQIAGVSVEDDMAHFDYLRLVQEIPFVYASFVSEAIKRREWLDKVKTDSSTLANEMALFHDEEVKRRKKWQKSVGNLAYGPSVTSAENQVAALEVNLLGEEADWPGVTRKDLEDLYDALQRQKADGHLIEDIGKTIADLNAPTKQQSKRIKAFKNGSVHEAALGRSGLMIRGDDDVLRSLQDDKTKIENKLRTAESRVRRLEDLLHRQSQASRASLGGVFQAAPSQQFSDRAESTASVKPGTPRPQGDRRTSLEGGNSSAAAAAAGDMRVAQRIQQLEADLAAEKERSATLEKNLETRTTEKTEILSRMDETNSTKKDLLENLEALKKEFTEERKSLEDEIKRLQARLEDTEDEMEHFGESRENEKATYDEKVRSVQAELERLTKEHRDETLKNQGQVEFLRKETKLQREQNESLEKQVQAAHEEAQASAKRIQEAKDAEELYVKGLRDLHEQLVVSEDSNVKSAPPTDAADLVEAVTSKLADALSRMQTTVGDMVIVRADLERAEAANRDLRNEMTFSKETLAGEEVAARRLREKLAEEKARITTLEEELGESRADLNQLRTKIADGETGSETLRKRLEEEEKKVLALTEEVVAKQSHLGSVEEELRMFQDKHKEAQTALSALTIRFDARTLRAKDLSQRLYTQNDRLCRLLERLGFSVTRDGDSMVIQKIPRSERSAIINGEGASSLLRRSSGMLTSTAAAKPGEPASPSTSNTANEKIPADVQLLYWMNSADGETEAAKYAEYMAAVGSFDIDTVAETVYRRVKEVEHIARKLQRDVRSYREKAHTLQKEAHDKIAFKHFKEGDLALFLPTRNQTSGAWAAFNIGFPHYFLREQEAHRLQNREWLVARISRVQEKVVDLSKSLQQSQQQQSRAPTSGETESIDNENDNPFDLSDGLRWYLIDAVEDKPGAPSTPGLGKSTVAANHVEAVADIHTHARTASGRGLGLGLVGGRPTGIDGVSKTLSRSLESRRSSTSSRKAAPLAAAAAAAIGHTSGVAGGSGLAAAALRGTAVASETNSLRAAPADTPEHAGSPTGPAVLSSTPSATIHGTTPSTVVTPPAKRPDAQRNPSSDAVADSNPPNNASEQQQVASLQRDHSALSEAPSKRSVVWDSLWAVDYTDGNKKPK